jgi:hypothetical protein
MAISLVAPGNGDTPSIALSSDGSTITLGQQNCAVDDLFIVFGGNKSSSTSTSIAVGDPGVGTPSTPTEWDLPSFPYNYGTASGATQGRVAVAWWFRITAADIDTAAGDLVEVEITPPNVGGVRCQYGINVWRGVGTTDFDGVADSQTMIGLTSQVDRPALGRTFTWTDSDTLPTTTSDPWSDTFFDSSMTVLAMAINDRSNWNAPSQLAFPSGWTTCIYGVGSTLASNEISSNGQSSVMLYSQYANFADADATSDPGMATPLDLADTSGNTTTTRQLTLWIAFKEDSAGVALTATLAGDADLTTATLTVAGATPTLTTTLAGDADLTTATLTVTGATPTLTSTLAGNADLTTATLTVAGATPTLTSTLAGDAELTTATLTVTGATPTLSASLAADADLTTATLTIAGATPALSASLSADAELTTATLTIAGEEVALTSSLTGDAELTTATLTIAGATEALTATLTGDAELTTATLTIAGAQVALTASLEGTATLSATISGERTIEEVYDLAVKIDGLAQVILALGLGGRRR